jgi:hypothetical protein
VYATYTSGNSSPPRRATCGTRYERERERMVLLSANHAQEVLCSYDRTVKQYRREIKLYEATHETAAEAAEK